MRLNLLKHWILSTVPADVDKKKIGTKVYTKKKLHML